jgi:hypothetical protein
MRTADHFNLNDEDCHHFTSKIYVYLGTNLANKDVPFSKQLMMVTGHLLQSNKDVLGEIGFYQ